jgi:hypothetical protein
MKRSEGERERDMRPCADASMISRGFGRGAALGGWPHPHREDVFWFWFCHEKFWGSFWAGWGWARTQRQQGAVYERDHELALHLGGPRRVQLGVLVILRWVARRHGCAEGSEMRGEPKLRRK